MSRAAGFVCAFRGARDRYQAPLALAEAGRLDRFITDAYATPLVRSLGASVVGGTLAARFEAGIPDDRVTCLWGTAFVEQVRHRLGRPPRLTWLKMDRRFSEAAAARARAARSNLFLYSPYAWEAFTASYAHDPMKVLFQYHPHSDTESRLLAQDRTRFPAFGESFEGQVASVPDEWLRRERDAWRHADLVVCSSAFTRQSLVDAGCPAELCRVVPYGVDLPSAIGMAPPPGFEVLFVGSGGHRKGLHHLLLAWQAARLPAGSRLTLVCRVIDRRIEAFAARVRNVEVIRGLPAAVLAQRYASSTLFAMPSLVEGFGHVYAEALAHGCPVLGTTHTCLPDLGSEADGIFLTAVAEVDTLRIRLEELAGKLPGDWAVRAAARATAVRHPWSGFRSQLTSVVS